MATEFIYVKNIFYFITEQDLIMEPNKKQIVSVPVTIGCDPEFFFTKNGVVIGSEKVLPKGGLISPYGDGKIIVDGVQAELNPKSDTCRERLGRSLSLLFSDLMELTKKDKDLCVDLSQTVTVDADEFDSLCDSSKKLGCSASQNIYSGSVSEISEEAKKSLKRSAGGHIHLGSSGFVLRDILHNPDRLVPILDIILGNTAVLIDRAESNKERRKVYGRAGEYRLPKHGLEYRTLSNFWLRSFQLFSLVHGLARQAVYICNSGLDKELLSLVNLKDVERAINENDFELAMKNFMKIKDFLMEITPESAHYPITPNNINKFMKFVENGSDFYFKEDPLEHWHLLYEGGRGTGFNDWLRYTVKV